MAAQTQQTKEADVNGTDVLIIHEALVSAAVDSMQESARRKTEGDEAGARAHRRRLQLIEEARMRFAFAHGLEAEDSVRRAQRLWLLPEQQNEMLDAAEDVTS